MVDRCVHLHERHSVVLPGCRLRPATTHVSKESSMANAPVNITITGAAGNIGYALLFRIASGALLGPAEGYDERLCVRMHPRLHGRRAAHPDK